MSDEPIKIKQTTTEIEVPREEERLVEIIVGLLSGTSASPPLGVRVSQGTGRSALGAKAEESISPAPDIEITAASKVVTSQAAPRRKVRASGIRRPSDAYIAADRKPKIDAICAQGPEDERYNAAIRKHTRVGDRALLVISLARERANLSGLSIPEASSVLERKFRVPVTLNAIGLGLARMAAKSEEPLVSGSEASWDRSKTEYWLTEPGLDYVKSLVGD